MHKETGQLFTVKPWLDADIPYESMILEMDGYPMHVVITVVQLGWLISRETYVPFGFDISIKENFEDLGEL